MTEPSGRPRRRRNSSSARNPLRDLRRPVVVLGALAVLVLIAAGLSVALSGGLPGSTIVPSTVPSVSTASSAATSASIALGTSPSASTASSSPVASGSPGTSLAATSEPGIRASRIQIARLGIDLSIVDGDGIDAPLGKAAHYPGTGWPGGGTNIYIYGHARAGMFLRLWDAVVGDKVDLLLADGSKRSYIVDKVLPRVPWDAIKYLQPTKAEQLTLQTSTGPNGSDPRFVVIAHPAP